MQMITFNGVMKTGQKLEMVLGQIQTHWYTLFDEKRTKLYAKCMKVQQELHSAECGGRVPGTWRKTPLSV